MISGHLYLRRLSAVERLRRKTTSRITANGRLNHPNDRVIHLSFLYEEIIETSNYADREKNVKYKYDLNVRLLTFFYISI